jgi:Flp pilus assembly protein TadD
VELATKAVKLAPTDAGMWNTLGVAQYRVGNYEAAIEALNKATELRKRADAADYFFLAMAESRLGNKNTAHQLFREAVQSMEMKAPTNAELIRFRSEAAEQLGLKIVPGTRPATQPATTTRPATTPAR